MEEQPERRKLAPADQVSRVFGMIMVVLYIVLGTTIIFRPPWMKTISERSATILGVILILYGIFRAWKVYRRYY